MFSNKLSYDFANQLLAWLAIAMLFVQPFSLSGNICKCGSTGERVATDLQQIEMTCCRSAKVATKCCCANEQESCCTAIKNSPCRCGDQCRCSAKSPGKPLPAVPPADTQTEQSLTLALMLSVSTLDAVVPDTEFGRQTSSARRPAFTAQESCVLLSRFNC